MEEQQWFINVVKQIIKSTMPDNEKVSLIKQMYDSYEAMKEI